MKRELHRMLAISLLLMTSCLGEPTGGIHNATEVPSGNSTAEKHYLVNNVGDTIPTGVPISIVGKRIDADSVAPPVKVALKRQPRRVSVRNNVIPAGQPRVVNVTGSPTTIIPGQDGYSLPVSTKAEGSLMQIRYSEPVPALPLKKKNTATASIQDLSVNEGMPYSYTMSIAQDSLGYLWFGTGNGFSRYDGNSFLHYTIREGLTSNWAREILTDSRGILWFAVWGSGLVRYDGHTFTNYLSNLFIISAFEDHEGNLWFGTENSGMIRYAPGGDDEHGSFTHYTTKEGLSHNNVPVIFEDKKGKLWFGTAGGGLNRFDPQANEGHGSFTHYTKEEGLIHNLILSMAEDRWGNLWIGTGGGVNRYDPKANNGKGRFIHYTTSEGLIHNFVYGMKKDRNGHLWIATQGGGVCRFDPDEDGMAGSFRYYSRQEGLSTNNIDKILEDSQGYIWIGTGGGGANRLSESGFTHFTTDENFDDNRIRSMFEDSRGKMWFGTRSKGVSSFDGEVFTHYTLEEGLVDNDVASIHEDSLGNIWIGTSGGLSYFNGQSFINYSAEEGLAGDIIYDMLLDRQGHLWAGGRNGLCRFDGKSFTHYTTREGFNDNYVLSLLEDRRNNVWIGTRSGLARFTPADSSFTFYTVNEGLSHNIIWGMIEDSWGRLWLATNYGISRFDPYETATFVHYTTEDGLSHNAVWSLQEDQMKNIWAGTEHGITLLRPSFPEHSVQNDVAPDVYQCFSYGAADGLKRANFEWRSALIDRNNRIWWGSIDGLTTLNLKQLDLPTKPPQHLSLSHIEIGQQFIDYRQLYDTAYSHQLSFGKKLSRAFDSVALFSNYPLNLKLPHDLNHLTFHFSALDWQAPHKIRYQYFMEGLDAGWSQPGAESKADYRNLPHGDYTLKVRANGAAGIWSKPFAYSFTIYPPWWHTWWAYALYVIAVLLVLTGLYLYQRRRWQLQTQLEVEQEKAHRLQELDHFKSRFYTNITHEFRTPLTVIQGIAGQIGKDKKAGEMIRRNSDRLLQMINQLLDLSKMEQNSLGINWVQGDVIPYLQYLTESCHSLAENKQLNLAFFSQEESLVMDYDELKLQQILINLLSNAIKFTPEYGSVKVTAAQVELEQTAFLQLTVRDTGFGIPADELPHIFDRFYQVDASSTRVGEGSGIGLALVKELVHLLEGRFKVESEPDKGSTFKIYLPIHKQAKQQVAVGAFVEPVLVKDVTLQPDPFEETGSLSNGEKPLVLIIEDNADVTEYVVSCLNKEYTLITARNGNMGIEKALENIPDVILSDVMMPGMDGFEVCRQLKSDRRTSHIPVILLTAKATQEDKVAGLSLGADAYLTKPFDKRELLVRLNNLAAQSRRLRERLSHPEMINDQPTEQEQREAAFLKEVDQVIEANLNNELFNTNYFCRTMAMSRSQLYRKIKALTGHSTAGYIRSIRLQKAKHLLKTTDLPIGEIAVQVGFKDFSHFSRSFSKKFGFSPSDTRK